MSDLSVQRSLAKARTRKCKVCGSAFVPRQSIAPTCDSFECKVAYAEKVAAKSAAARKAAERKATRAKRQSLKRLAQLAKEAEQYVNLYVRLRDADKSCISCDRPASWDGQWHASHFKSVGANSALRFHLWNIHKACSICNAHLSGNIGEYTRRLPERIGQERFDFIQSHDRVRRYSREYLIRLKDVAKRACKRLEKRGGK